MVGTNATPTALPYTALAPPPPAREAETQRAVEPTSRAAPHTSRENAISMAPATVLYLLKNSAAHFADVLEKTDDALGAGTVSGFSMGTVGGGVDTYA